MSEYLWVKACGKQTWHRIADVREGEGGRSKTWVGACGERVPILEYGSDHVGEEAPGKSCRRCDAAGAWR